MWKVIADLRCTFIHRRLLDVSRLKHAAVKKRLFLSEAYRCQEAWEKRLQTPILQRINLNDFYQELEGKFSNEGKASAIDVDLFANKVNSESYIDELEDIIHKLRLSPNTTDTLPSTPHSFIRLLLAVGKHDELLRVLDDRLNYGIFPDDYCNALLMDTFLKEKNYTGAVRVGVMQMLQEDWAHPLVSHLALISCYMYLKNPESWVQTDETEKPKDDGEEIKVRVKYLRNPYFDDHFDLHDPKLLVGKTLAMLGKHFPDAIGKTYQLIGWGMYQKWDKALAILEQILNEKQKPSLFKEGIELFKNSIEDIKGEDGQENEMKNKSLKLLQEVESLGLVTDDNLQELIENKVKSVVSSMEKQMIEEQCKLYSDWEISRDNLLQQQLDELKRHQQIIFFFDNEEKLELAIEKNEVIVNKQKLHKKVTSQSKDEDYIPPDVRAVTS
ncbi:hypothetical protein L9F63_001449 [Diploptera punctata]|uniref:Mitochondrial 28S ribosomal protein S27 n=1 Tax=Diploptera punctata TaxID=6984 RepID=A0AAD8A3K7_DIPPU|nr:hypothetical protein L9F63_001449 [Diploptera punctata]